MQVCRDPGRAGCAWWPGAHPQGPRKATQLPQAKPCCGPSHSPGDPTGCLESTVSREREAAVTAGTKFQKDHKRLILRNINNYIFFSFFNPQKNKQTVRASLSLFLNLKRESASEYCRLRLWAGACVKGMGPWKGNPAPEDTCLGRLCSEELPRA